MIRYVTVLRWGSSPLCFHLPLCFCLSLFPTLLDATSGYLSPARPPRHLLLIVQSTLVVFNTGSASQMLPDSSVADVITTPRPSLVYYLKMCLCVAAADLDFPTFQDLCQPRLALSHHRTSFFGFLPPLWISLTTRAPPAPELHLPPCFIPSGFVNKTI